MAEIPVDDVRFSDEELAEILKKASDPRNQRPTTSSGVVMHAEGVSLSELRTIGEEVGIDRRRLEDAARAVVRRRGSSPRNRLLGPLVRDTERTVDGELPVSATPDALALIRRAVGQKGEASEIQDSLEWHSTSEAIDRYVTVTPRDGRTIVRGSTNMTGLAMMTYLPTGLLSLVLSIIGFMAAANAANPAGMIASLLLVPALYAIVRTLLGRYGSAQADKMERLVDEVALLAEQQAPQEPKT